MWCQVYGDLEPTTSGCQTQLLLLFIVWHSDPWFDLQAHTCKWQSRGTKIRWSVHVCNWVLSGCIKAHILRLVCVSLAHPCISIVAHKYQERLLCNYTCMHLDWNVTYCITGVYNIPECVGMRNAAFHLVHTATGSIRNRCNSRTHLLMMCWL